MTTQEKIQWLEELIEWHLEKLDEPFPDNDKGWTRDKHIDTAYRQLDIHKAMLTKETV